MKRVFITGAARSGTSMVCGVLAANGLEFGGPLYSKRREYQPRGFWEHRKVREEVLKPLLKSLKVDPRGQDPLPERFVQPNKKQVERFRRRVEKRLGKAQAYKDAKILLVWPYFRQAFPDAKWIIVRRDRMEIARSCYRTPFMKRRKTVSGWLDWVDEHERRMTDLTMTHPDLFEFWPKPNEPERFRQLLTWLGLEYDEDKVLEALVPEAWHEGGA